MAPAKQHKKPAQRCENFNSKKKLVRRSTVASRLRLVQCTVHLDQIHENGELKAMPKLKQSYLKRTEGRLVHPLVFKPFSPEMLDEASPDGNVTFIMELESLLTRFPRCAFLHQLHHGRLEVLLTKKSRNISCYTCGVVFDETDDVKSRMKALSNLKNLFSGNLSLFVDVLPVDKLFFKKCCVKEYLSHVKCDARGDLCPSLLRRSAAWKAHNFLRFPC